MNSVAIARRGITIWFIREDEMCANASMKKTLIGTFSLFGLFVAILLAATRLRSESADLAPAGRELRDCPEPVPDQAAPRRAASGIPASSASAAELSGLLATVTWDRRTAHMDHTPVFGECRWFSRNRGLAGRPASMDRRTRRLARRGPRDRRREHGSVARADPANCPATAPRLARRRPRRVGPQSSRGRRLGRSDH